MEDATELAEMASRRDMICNQDTAPCPIGSGPGGGTPEGEQAADISSPITIVMEKRARI